MDLRYISVDPQEIEIGCIVEVQFSVMAVQTDRVKDKYRHTAILRVVTILDDTVARVSEF